MKVTVFQMRTNEDFKERIRRQAERFGMDMSTYIRQCLVQKLEQDEASAPKKGKRR